MNDLNSILQINLIKINMTNQEKSFIEACINNNIKGAKTCLKYGVDIHIEDNWSIDIAAKNGFNELISLLLKNGISHEIAATKGLLAYLCHFEHIGLINKIIRESDAYKIDKSAFSWTAIKGNIFIGELLLEYLNKENLEGGISRAAEYGKIEFLDFLIGNSIDQIDSSSERAVYWAAEKGKWNTVKYLLEHSIGSLEKLGKYRNYYEENYGV